MATESTGSTAPIVVSAAIIRDATGRILLVRKRGTTRFMMPGGKPEPGESPLDTVVREVAEEVGIDLDPATVESWGRIKAVAANEADTVLLADVFDCGTVDGDGSHITVAAEIAELRWHDVTDDDRDDLAPLFVDDVLPILRRQAPDTP
ncbi:NUDIX hydrolase [Williamsia deligens]|uniref:NUDIX domain-containing protein n=1 Tax=Williamsia deligens TaxID=321325 RepID=A0ABW3G3X3_9NOCA|nr:NUDIX domain-containing protein [Williamsia deligens]MCP2193986.1 8-oxo-dGTP pyrophosphatase MutT, NUDIX family [Williamsia deligens]